MKGWSPGRKAAGGSAQAASKNDSRAAGAAGADDDGDLPPLAPDKLEIARLARRQAPQPEPTDKPEGPGVNRVVVGLNRERIKVADSAHFRLKMALVKTLRRRFKRASIEIDDVEPGQMGEALFEVELEPDNSALRERTNASVARALRSKRWQHD
jgi:hypothetical protein